MEDGQVAAFAHVYNSSTVGWEPMRQPSTGGAEGSTQVSVSNFPATLTDAQLRATPVPVSGGGSTQVSVSNFPATQPVSGTVSVTDYIAPSTTVAVSNWPATQPVSGTFWQATQPVSGPLTDAELRATPVPVSGTLITWEANWPETQPVSLSLTASTTAAGESSAAGDLTLLSSQATALHVFAFAVQKYSSVANVLRFMDGSTRAAWYLSKAGPNGGGTGSTGIAPGGLTEVCVTPPAYLFRTAAGNPLILSRSSTGHCSYSVAAWRA